MIAEIFAPFIIRALAAGLGLAAIAGPLGCFIVWKRMAYFGDALSHSALIGIALGLALQLPLQIGMILICSLFALLMLILQRHKIISSDTMLGILAHTALSYGLIAITLIPGVSIDLHDVLFGDILAITQADITWIFVVGVIVLSAIYLNWSKLLLATLNADLARAEGQNTDRLQGLLLICLTLTVMIAVQVVGILLVTAMLIIPAAIARFIAKSPEVMAIGAVVIGMGGTIAGLYISLMLDIPTAPTIVATLATTFFSVSLIRLFHKPTNIA